MRAQHIISGIVFLLAGLFWTGTLSGEEIGNTVEHYTVQKGDTLWGISNSILSDPFLWPKVWGVNSGIKNPDRIHPGLQIRFPGRSKTHVETAPPPVVQASVPSVVPPSEPAPSPQKETTVPQRPVMAKIPSPLPKPTMEIDAAKPTQDPFQILAVGAIVQQESQDGSVIGGNDDRGIFGAGDLVYLRSSKGPLEPGQELVVYRVRKDVHHPKTGRHLGKLINVLGQVKVLWLEDDFASAKILRSLHEIQPGDQISSSLQFPEESSRGLPGGLDGYIVEAREENVEYSFLDVVYIDRGLNDGVGPGDRFSILRDGRSLSSFVGRGPSHMPQRKIGELQVLISQEDTATARITQSNEPIVLGDRLLSLLKP